MASKPVVARLETGEEFGYATPAKVPEGAVIVRYQDGTEYVEPKKADTKKDAKSNG